MLEEDKKAIKIRFDITPTGIKHLMAMFRERGVSEEEIEKCFPRVRYIRVDKNGGPTDSESN
jgi:hypothetical protein